MRGDVHVGGNFVGGSHAFAGGGHSGVATVHGGIGHGGLLDSHASSGTHASFGIHQEPFHGLLPRHDVHHDLHHDDVHFGFGLSLGYYPRRYTSYDPYYYEPYYPQAVYVPTTVIEQQPVVIYAEGAPTPDQSAVPVVPAGLPGSGSALGDGHRMESVPPILRVPLVETTEAPEVLPPSDKPR